MNKGLHAGFFLSLALLFTAILPAQAVITIDTTKLVFSPTDALSGASSTLLDGRNLSISGSTGCVLDTTPSRKHRVFFNWGDGTANGYKDITTAGATNFSAVSHAYNYAGTYTLTIWAGYPNGTNTSTDVSINYTFEVTVTSGPPLVVLNPTTKAVTDATNAILSSITLYDGLQDGPWSGTIDWGDGTAVENLVINQATKVVTVPKHVYNPSPTPYILMVTITDNNDQTTTGTCTVTVTDAAPGVTLNPTTKTQLDNVLFGLTSITLIDSAADSPWTGTLDWGDGSPVVDLTINPETRAVTLPLKHQYQVGTYTLTVIITDNKGLSTTKTCAMIINNGAPIPGTMSVLPGGTRYEGTELTASFPNLADGDLVTGNLTYTWSVTKGGAAYTAHIGPTNEPTFRFTPDDQGTYVVTGRVTDSYGLQSAAIGSGNLTIMNAAPVLTGPIALDLETINEGDIVTATVPAATDAGLLDTTFTYTWTWKKGTSTIATHTTTVPTDSQLMTDNYSTNWTLTVSVKDKDNLACSPALVMTIIVNNLPPTVTGITNIPTVEKNENAAISPAFGFTYTDPASPTKDTLNAYQWGVLKESSTPGVYEPYTGLLGTSTSSTYTFTPNDNGTYKITLKVRDKDGDWSEVYTSDSFVVVNIIPVLGNISVTPSTRYEGTELTASTTLADSMADKDAGITMHWVWKKAGEIVVEYDEIAYVSPATTTYTPNDNASWTIVVTATDKDGGVSAAKSVNITVANAVPVLTGEVTLEPATLNEGDTVVATVPEATDTGELDTISYVWTWKKGTTTVATNTTTEPTNAMTITDNADDWTLSVVAKDNNGGTSTPALTTAFVVNNLPPVITALNGAQAVMGVGDVANLSVSFTDPGPGDLVFTYAWSVTRDGAAWGSVSTSQFFTFTPTEVGRYVIAVKVTDKDGGFDTAQSGDIVVSQVAGGPFITGVTFSNSGPEPENFSPTNKWYENKNADKPYYLHVQFDYPGDPANVKIAYDLDANGAWDLGYGGDGDSLPSYDGMLAVGPLQVTDALYRNDWDMRAGFLCKRYINCMLLDDAGKYTNPYKIVLPTLNLPISNITLTPTPAQPVRGEKVSFYGTFADGSPDDQHTVTIVWGDGTSNTKLSLPAARKYYTTTHTFTGAAMTAADEKLDYSIKVTLADYTKLSPDFKALYTEFSTVTLSVYNYLRRTNHEIQRQTPTVGGWVGTDIIGNAAGEGEAIDLGAIASSTVTTFLLKVTNLGSTSDTFAVKAACDTDGYTATVFDAATGGADVTGQVNGDTGWQFTLARGASKTYRLVFQVNAGAPEGVPQILLITAASLTADTPRVAEAVDGVRIIATPMAGALQQPDLKAKTSTTTPYLGEGIYSATGINQKVGMKVLAGKTATYFVRVQNDGTETDTITVTAASVPGPAWNGSVVYRLGTTGTTAVPAEITTTGWSVGPLAPGAFVDFRVQVITDPGMPTTDDDNPAYTVTLSAVSQGDASKQDVMQLVTKTAAAYQPDMLIRKDTDTADAGNNVWNADGANQTVGYLQTGLIGQPTVFTFKVRVQNDGQLADAFTITAPDVSGGGWNVKYYLDSTDEDITTAVNDVDGYLIPSEEGMTLPRTESGPFIRVVVTADSTVLRGRSLSVLITGTSVGSGTGEDMKLDVVKATATKL